MTESSCCLPPKMQQILSTQILFNDLADILGGVLYTSLYPLSRAGEVIVAAIHDEGDGLALCERLS